MTSAEDLIRDDTLKYKKLLDNAGTVEDFYLHGDSAPYGRLCYRYRFGQPE